MKIIKLALENDNSNVEEAMVEQPVVIAEPEIDNEVEIGTSDILNQDTEMAEQFDDNQTVQAIMESLNTYATEAENLIKSNTCTKATLNLLMVGTQQQMNLLNRKFSAVSLESYEDDIVRQHQIVLESIRDVINVVFQSFVIDWKQQINIQEDIFRNSEGKVRKYKSKIKAGKEEFNSVKGSFTEQEHHINMVSLWPQFSDGAGPVHDIPAALQKDLIMSKYVLTDYPKQMIDLLNKLTAIVKNVSVKTEDDFMKVANKVAALSHPVDLFKENFVTSNRPYLDAMGLQEKTGTKRSSQGNEKAYATIAKLATSRVIVESTGLVHQIKQVINIPTGTESDMYKSMKISTAEIGKVFDAGDTYLNNATTYIEMKNLFSKAVKDYSDAIENFGKAINEVKDSKINAVAKQIGQYGSNIIHCFQSPATRELSRAITTAKFCDYLGLRAIYNAKKQK